MKKDIWNLSSSYFNKNEIYYVLRCASCKMEYFTIIIGNLLILYFNKNHFIRVSFLRLHNPPFKHTFLNLKEFATASSSLKFIFGMFQPTGVFSWTLLSSGSLLFFEIHKSLNEVFFSNTLVHFESTLFEILYLHLHKLNFHEYFF